MALDPVKSRKRRRKLLRVIGLVTGVVLGWWAGAKLTRGPTPEPTTAPSSR
jgi:hypothetical protein